MPRMGWWGTGVKVRMGAGGFACSPVNRPRLPEPGPATRRKPVFRLTFSLGIRTHSNLEPALPAPRKLGPAQRPEDPLRRPGQRRGEARLGAASLYSR